jgi:YVTN family beta-propeller protein
MRTAYRDHASRASQCWYLPSLAFLLALLSFARAQRVEKVILLPDETAGISYPDVLCHNETEDHIYVSGWVSSGVVVLDADALRRIGRYETGYGVTDLAWSRGFDRVYSADFYDSTVTVYDAGAGQVIATIPGLDRPYRLLLDEPRDKLYVICDYKLVAVNLAANTVLAEIPIPANPIAMLADTARNRLLVTGSHDSLYFVDPDADSVIKALPVPVQGYLDLLALSETSRKLYITGSYSSSLVTICLDGDSVAATHTLGGQHWSILWHPGRDLLYVGSAEPGLRVFDCRTDSLIKTFDEVGSVMDIAQDTAQGRDRLCICASPPLGIPGYVYIVDCETQTLQHMRRVGRRMARVLPVPGRDQLWVADREGSAVAVLDGASLVELAWLDVGTKVAAVAWDSIDNRLYAANARSTNVSVIDGNDLTVIDTIGVSPAPSDLLWVPELNKLYVATQVEHRIHVIDCDANRVVATLPGRGAYNHLAYSPASNKVYCSVYSIAERLDSSVVIVIDGSSNQILTEVVTGPSATRLFWYPDSNWMYCARYRSISVIDCETDSIITTIPDLEGPSEMVLNPTNNSIYVAHGSPPAPPFELLVINAPAHRIRKRLPLNGWPYPVAWNSEKNEVYVGVVEEGEVCVVDCRTDSIAATIATPGAGYLVDIVWNHVDDKLYCPDIIANAVYIIDVPTRQVSGTLPIRSWPLELAWDPVANRTYVPTWEGSNVTVLRGGPPAIAGPAETAKARPVGQTIVRDMLWLPLDMTHFGSGNRALPQAGAGSPAHRVPRPALLDITGRQVMSLQPGENDIRHIAPGVYFVRRPETEDRKPRSAARKVVIQR